MALLFRSSNKDRVATPSVQPVWRAYRWEDSVAFSWQNGRYHAQRAGLYTLHHTLHITPHTLHYITFLEASPACYPSRQGRLSAESNLGRTWRGGQNLGFGLQPWPPWKLAANQHSVHDALRVWPGCQWPPKLLHVLGVQSCWPSTSPGCLGSSTGAAPSPHLHNC